jgi:protein-disulfide isomerase
VWAALASAASHVAARIDGEEISIATVDAVSLDQVQHIRGRLLEVARGAVQDLVDRRLGIKHPAERAKLYSSRNVQLMVPESYALETRLPAELVVASIGDDPIRAAAVEEKEALRLYRLRGELYLQRRRNLAALIDQRLLRLEARRQGMSPEELEHSLAQTEAVTNAELEEFVSRERAAGRKVEDPERVRPYLAFQKAYRRRASLLEAARAQTRIDIDLRPPTRPQLPLDTDAGVTFGSSGGRILVVYTNYRCALCRATHLEIDRLLGDKRPPRIVFRDFVRDPVAMEAAALVRCAARTGRAAAMRTLLLSSDPPPLGTAWLSAEGMESAAHSAGMTVPMLRACTRSPEIRGQIEQDTRAAQRLGFDDPPAFVAAGIPLSGMQSADLLRDALEGRSRSELSVD